MILAPRNSRLVLVKLKVTIFHVDDFYNTWNHLHGKYISGNTGYTLHCIGVEVSVYGAWQDGHS